MWKFCKNKQEALFSYTKTLRKRYQKGDATVVLRAIKLGAAFLFMLGVVGALGSGEIGSIQPLNAAADEEVMISDTGDTRDTLPTEVFANARINTPIDPDDYTGIGGGGLDPSFVMSGGSALLSYHMPEAPEIPSKERSSITTYIVKPNDTPSAIAQKFGLKLNTLLWSNDLDSPNLVHPGDKLFIMPVDGIMYDVEQGDTLSSIATRHEAKVADILQANDMASAQHIIAGQKLIIPGGIKSAPTRNAPPARRNVNQHASNRHNLAGYFSRPAIGYVSQGYHGWHRALDIANSCRTPVYAAASGTVTRSVNLPYDAWVGGYGNVVEISHPNGMQTLYAHFMPSGVAVQQGQWVNKGEFIGSMGTTGRSSGCHVHWEVRINGVKQVPPY